MAKTLIFCNKTLFAQIALVLSQINLILNEVEHVWEMNKKSYRMYIYKQHVEIPKCFTQLEMQNI